MLRLARKSLALGVLMSVVVVVVVVGDRHLGAALVLAPPVDLLALANVYESLLMLVCAEVRHVGRRELPVEGVGSE